MTLDLRRTEYRNSNLQATVVGGPQEKGRRPGLGGRTGTTGVRLRNRIAGAGTSTLTGTVDAFACPFANIVMPQSSSPEAG